MNLLNQILNWDKVNSKRLYKLLTLTKSQKRIVKFLTGGHAVVPLIFLMFLVEENKAKFILFVIFFFAILLFLELGFKRIFNRKRPEYSDIKTRSFPSSHAFGFWASTTIYYFAYQQYQYWLIFLIIFAIYSFLVSILRIILGYHYILDVLVGGLMGIIFGLVIIFLKIF